MAVALTWAGAAACGDGKTAIQWAPDAARSDAADAADASGDAAARDDADAADGDVDTFESGGDAGADAAEAGGDLVAAPETHDAADAGVVIVVDAPVEHASATASWTLASFATCMAAGAGCMDTGAVGGYQITASGACPTASDVQLWFPGGASPLAAGTYAVKAAAGILDVIAMPAGMVGVLAEREDTSMTTARYWGLAGTVTVSATGAARHVTFTGVSLKEETSGAMTTLGADVSCP